jgi:hypothetical protein
MAPAAPQTPSRPLAPAGSAAMPLAAAQGPASNLVFRDPVSKVVGAKGEERELRKLSPEEKAQRRFRRNIIMLTAGFAILLISLIILLQL